MVYEHEPKPAPLLKLEPNLVLLLSVVMIPVIIAGSIVILGTVRAEMNQLVGGLLEGAAEDTARHLDSYLLNSMTTVSIIGTSPVLHETVEEANRVYQGDPERIEAELHLSDELWVKSRGALQMALDVVAAPASEHLRGIQAIRPSYDEILLTDRFGALVAATNIASDYYQADETWWRTAYGDGTTGSLYFGSVQFDRSAGAYTLELAVPLSHELEGGSSEVTGVLKVLVDAEELLSVIGSVRRGQSGHALLVDSREGTVVAGSDTSDVMKRDYPALRQLRESLSEGRRTFFSQQADAAWLTGYAGMPQPSPAPYGDWIVVVEQLYDEVNAPTERATLFLVVFFALMVLLVIIFSLYLHYKLVKPIREIDLREEMDRLAAAESPASTG